MLKGSIPIEIRQPIGAQTFRRLAHVKRHVPNRNETSGSVSESLNSKVVYFLLCAVFWIMRAFLLHGRLAEYFDS